MKCIFLTDEEIETLIWAIQGKTISEAKRLIAEGKAPSKDETVQRLNAISNRAYIALTV